jgi:hypothetical protein
MEKRAELNNGLSVGMFVRGKVLPYTNYQTGEQSTHGIMDDSFKNRAGDMVERQKTVFMLETAKYDEHGRVQYFDIEVRLTKNAMSNQVFMGMLDSCLNQYIEVGVFESYSKLMVSPDMQIKCLNPEETIKKAA